MGLHREGQNERLSMRPVNPQSAQADQGALPRADSPNTYKSGSLSTNFSTERIRGLLFIAEFTLGSVLLCAGRTLCPANHPSNLISAGPTICSANYTRPTPFSFTDEPPNATPPHWSRGWLAEYALDRAAQEVQRQLYPTWRRKRQ